jgi:hypothetical protein
VRRDDTRAARSAGSRRADCGSTLRTLSALFALQDRILLAYLALTALVIWRAPPGPLLADCARVSYLSMAALGIGCFVSRGLVQLSARLRAAIYCAAIGGVLVTSYLTLGDLLELVRPEEQGEALCGVFVSLHTAFPLWLALHAFRHARISSRRR